MVMVPNCNYHGIHDYDMTIQTEENVEFLVTVSLFCLTYDQHFLVKVSFCYYQIPKTHLVQC